MKEFFFEETCPYCGGNKMVDRMESGYNWVVYCVSCNKKIREDREKLLEELREMWISCKKRNNLAKLKAIEEVASVAKAGDMQEACKLYSKYGLGKPEPASKNVYDFRRKDGVENE